MPQRAQRISNSAPCRGDLMLTVRDAVTRRKIRTLTIRNMIVNNGFSALVNLLAQKTTGAAASTLGIASLRVGAGAVAPVKTDAGLSGATLATLALVDASKTVTTIDPTFELKIIATLEADQANGETLTEAGLFLADDTLFARQIYPGISKNAAIVIDYDWRISFTPFTA